jgi:hypothetical protein
VRCDRILRVVNTPVKIEPSVLVFPEGFEAGTYYYEFTSLPEDLRANIAERQQGRFKDQFRCEMYSFLEHLGGALAAFAVFGAAVFLIVEVFSSIFVILLILALPAYWVFKIAWYFFEQIVDGYIPYEEEPDEISGKPMPVGPLRRLVRRLLGPPKPKKLRSASRLNRGVKG